MGSPWVPRKCRDWNNWRLMDSWLLQTSVTEFSHGDWTVKNKDLTKQHNGAKTIINHPFGNGLYHLFGHNFEPRKIDDRSAEVGRKVSTAASTFIPWQILDKLRAKLGSFLVGGFNRLENDGVRQWVSDDIPYMKWKHKKCLKPPTRSKIIDHHKYMG